jgi:hypothetical protein
MLNNIRTGWQQLTTKLSLGILFGFVIVFSWPVAAEVFNLDTKWVCGETQALGKELRSAGEQVVGVGSMDGIIMVSIWVNVDSRTWTIVASPLSKKETSCIVVHGDKFKAIEVRDTI